MYKMNNSQLDDNEYRFEEWNIQPPLSRTVRILLAVFLIIVCAVGTIGNIVVLTLFLKYKSLRTTSNVFVVNLTTADLMMCLVCLPTLVDRYLRGHTGKSIERLLCNFDTFFGAFTGFLSIWSLVCLAIDRCIVITRHIPVRYSSEKSKASFVVMGVWLLALAGAGLPFIGYGQFVLKGSAMSCGDGDYFFKSFPNIFYNIMIQVVYFLIPITCIISCYAVIFIKVRNHERRYFDGRKGSESVDAFRRTCRSGTLERNELKTAKAGLILIAVFCFSWAPYSIVSWIGLFGNRKSLTPIAIALPAVFAKVSTILNPLFYALLLQSFKSKLALFCKMYFSSALASNISWERSQFNQTQGARSRCSNVTSQRRHSPITAV